MKRLCSICARGGSKGVSGKNLRPLCGRPLIAHSIEQAKASGQFVAIAVSSDNADILSAADTWGADILIERPADMASDVAPKVPAIRHCAIAAEARLGIAFDTFVDLDATSPLRNPEDIRGAVAMLEASTADNLITGMPSRRSPYFNLVEMTEHGRVALAKKAADTVTRRQDAPSCFDLNASIYVWRRNVLLDGSGTVIGNNTILFEMPEERSIDIDSELDFRIVAMLMSERVAA